MRASLLSRLSGIVGAAVLMAATSGAIVSAHARTVRPQAGQTVGWTSTDANLQGWRYSSLTQIDTANVSHLKVAWRFNTGVLGADEDHPLIIGNTAYVVTAFNHVYALNATTGAQIWTFTPKEQPEVACCGPDARGLAYHDGILYMLTLDDQLIALNAATGAVKYDVYIQSSKNGVAETASPLYYNGLIYIGSSGSELGIRGFEEARYASNGKLAWIFYTVPPRSQSWVKINHGIAGGSIWNNPVIDAGTNTMYIATGNPAPLLYGLNRPGADHWTDSVIALNASTGKMKWAFSTVPHDMWDYDDSSNPILFPTTTGLGVGEAGKSGMWFQFDAKTGEQTATAEPFVNVFHPYEPSLSGKPVLVSPSPLGGDPWSPTAFDPQTGNVYIEGNNSSTLLTASARGDVYKGGNSFYAGSTFKVLPGIQSNLTAMSVGSGTIAWQYNYPKAAGGSEGGPTTTAGGLVFAAETQIGKVLAFNAKTGKLLWSTFAGGPVGGGVSVYMVNGKEYILVPVGGAGLMPGLGKLAKVPDEFVAYTLGN